MQRFTILLKPPIGPVVRSLRCATSMPTRDRVARALRQAVLCGLSLASPTGLACSSATVAPEADSDSTGCKLAAASNANVTCSEALYLEGSYAIAGSGAECDGDDAGRLTPSQCSALCPANLDASCSITAASSSGPKPWFA